jgi:hypothetical protein
MVEQTWLHDLKFRPLQAQPTDWQREINNNLARLFMETSNMPVPPPQEYDPEPRFHPV